MTASSLLQRKFTILRSNHDAILTILAVICFGTYVMCSAHLVPRLTEMSVAERLSHPQPQPHRHIPFGIADICWSPIWALQVVTASLLHARVVSIRPHHLGLTHFKAHQRLVLAEAITRNRHLRHVLSFTPRCCLMRATALRHASRRLSAQGSYCSGLCIQT